MSPRRTAKIDRETQALYGVLADRIARMQGTPGVEIGSGKDMRFQSVDRFAIAEAKHSVVHNAELWTAREGAT